MDVAAKSGHWPTMLRSTRTLPRLELNRAVRDMGTLFSDLFTIIF